MIHIFVVMIDALTSKFFCLGHGLQHQCRIRRVEFPIPRPLRSVVRILQVKYSNLLQNIYNIFTIWIKNISNTKTFALGGLDIASEFTSCNESHAHVHLIPTKPLFFFERYTASDSIMIFTNWTTISNGLCIYIDISYNELFCNDSILQVL